MVATLATIAAVSGLAPARPLRQPGAAAAILAGARAQLVKPAIYDASYRRIAYPMGDVPADRGACSDVVIRALRNAGYDLQKLIHEDMARAAYPRKGARRDRNIDHRRVANQRFFFRRFGEVIPHEGIQGERSKTWQIRPGDIITWKLPNNLDHIGIVTDKVVDGRPLLIHNIRQTIEEDVLLAWPITGHYRFPR